MSAAGLDLILDAPAADLPAAVAVMHRAFAEYARTGTPSGAMLETAPSLLAEREDGVRVALARRDGTVVAMVKHQDAADGSRYFGRLAVDPGQRGRGVARALIEALRDDALGAGRSGLTCLVRADEPRAIAFYQALGMVVEGSGERVSRTGATIRVVEMADPRARTV
ncbi:GNAT family N-acetyltransferase [Demequina sp. SYSU T00039]|uniref:GNAT family N-acetyltransferase n=1 Tax=Demequina lignilytica TaxID=3051663 RepID=A0AAW7M3G9_9MICO|nr:MULTISPECIES: GNAT family N-acetyltransferase [unclassified Demequina]MDN4477736.1 GNAT family N-acetyltransferase [Demequina sp. SYSU T00039-1]MDN4487645.1 GNAT family N-acetyltransferase [Demequina sp. SYSU T00039]